MYPLTKERETGEFGLSIPTDLAVAGSVGRHPDQPNNPKMIWDYNEVWFNLATLVRNAFGSFSSDDQKTLDASYLIDAVEEDIQALRDLYRQLHVSGNNPRPVVFYNNYQRVGQKLPRARPRTMKTTLQKQTFELHQRTMAEVIKNHSAVGEAFPEYDFDLKGNHPKVAMVTHQPVDLLSRRFFQELSLLESHTGLIKDKDTWYTKLGRDPELKRIPFDKAMIQIFGDGNNLLSMYPIKIRRKLFEIAEKKRWTCMTTKDKVLSNVRSNGEIELWMLLNAMYR